MIKKRLEWDPIFKGKAGKRLWKSIDKAKSKNEMRDVMYSMAWYIELLDERVNEMKKFIGERREF